MITANTGAIVGWIRENANLVVSIAGVTTALAALGAVATPVGTGIAVVAAAVRKLTTPVGLAVVAVGGLALAFKAVADEIERVVKLLPQVPSFLNPYGRFRGAPPPVAGGAGTPPAPAPLPRQRRVVPSFGQTFTDGATGFGVLTPVFEGKRFGGGGGQFAGFFGPLIDPLKVLEATKGIRDAATVLRGPIGTFSGRHASQILGGPSDRAAADRRKQIQLAQEQRDLLRELTRKRGMVVGGN